MLTSLLSLYITASISPPLPKTAATHPRSQAETVKSASFELSNLAKAKPIPIKNPYYIAPIIQAASTISVDFDTGTILYEKNAHSKLAIASITKLMTILIILEENDPTDNVTISANAASIEGSQMFLHEGEQIALQNLLYGALIHSANDAAIALAEHNAGSVGAFVKKMNEKAKSLGLMDTHFENPVGLDNPNNYSSAYDVAKLAQLLYQDSFIRHAAELKTLEVTSVSGAYTHKLETTNELLGNEYLNFKGLKTGHTDLAGLCLVSVAANEEGHQIITVVLNSPARFTETKVLTDWTFRAFNW